MGRRRRVDRTSVAYGHRVAVAHRRGATTVGASVDTEQSGPADRNRRRSTQSRYGDGVRGDQRIERHVGSVDEAKRCRGIG